MKQIPLAKSGKFALVDDADFDWLNQWKWRLSSKGYAIRSGIKIIRSMHRLIINTPDGLDTDHRDTNRLNNQRYNLRPCTRSQNHMNRQPKVGTASQFKGVSWFDRDKKWRSQIRVEGKLKHLGLFIIEVDAATAYNAAALEHYGEFARLNII